MQSCDERISNGIAVEESSTWSYSCSLDFYSSREALKDYAAERRKMKKMHQDQGSLFDQILFLITFASVVLLGSDSVR
jgi:hypothetical protein